MLHQMSVWVVVVASSAGAEKSETPNLHKIVLSIKLRFPPPPPRKSVNFEEFLLICTVFPHFGLLFGGGGGGYGAKPNFADKNFMDTQTFLKLLA